MMAFFLLSFIDIHFSNKKFSCFHLTEGDLVKIFQAHNGHFVYNSKHFTYSCDCFFTKKKASQNFFSSLIILSLFLQTVFFYPTFTPEHEKRFLEFKKEHVGSFPLGDHTLIISDKTFEGESYPVFIENEGNLFYINSKSCRPNHPLVFKALEDFLAQNIPPCCLPHLQEATESQESKETELNELLNFLNKS